MPSQTAHTFVRSMNAAATATTAAALYTNARKGPGPSE
jgi:hypothetical protein